MVTSERWWDEEYWIATVAPYVILMQALLDGRISPVEFEALFFPVWGSDRAPYGDEIYAVLNDVFAATEDFCFEDRLRKPGDLDASELVERVRHALEKLRPLATKPPE